MKFSDRVRNALASASKEAARLRHDYIGTEHILLGLLRDSKMIALLEDLGRTPDEVEALVMQSVRVGKAAPTSTYPFTDRAKKVLNHTLKAAAEVGSSFVLLEHLLLGILREEKGIAASVLNKLGITADRVISWSETMASQPRRPKIRIRIDDSSDRSIYEQIVLQITEAAATGALQPGQRLPAVRQLADELEIAPGTVARAYSELEQKGLVVTDGPRGTRLADRAPASPPMPEKISTLAGLLRPVAVAAFHLGAGAGDLRRALEEAMNGIFDAKSDAAWDGVFKNESSKKGRVMNYNFTDRFRQVVAVAREEAIRHQHDYLGTEHLLLGLIAEGRGAGAAVLTDLTVDLDQVKERIEISVRAGKATIAMGEIPYTSRAKKVLGLAINESRELNHSYVGTAHLLLGLIREEKGIAAEVLSQFGVTLDKARRKVFDRYESNPDEG